MAKQRKRRKPASANNDEQHEPALQQPAPSREVALLEPLSDPLPISTSTHYKIAIGLLILSGLLRLPWIGGKDLWFDEVQTYLDVQFPRAEGESHWIFFHITRFFSQFLSDPTSAMRLYPALLATATIPLLYLTFSRLIGRVAALLAALVLCFSPFHLEFSLEARYYAPMMFYATLALWASVEWATHRERWRWCFVPLALAADVLLFLHHPAAAPAALVHVAWLFSWITLSRNGMDSLMELVPQLRRLPFPRVCFAGFGVLAGVLFLLFASDVRTRLMSALFDSEWGQTANVKFAWHFFARHFEEFGWNFLAWGALRPLVAPLNVILMGAGLVLLGWKRPWFAFLIAGVIAGTFVGVFAVSLDSATYLNKYACAMVPLTVLCVGAALWILLQLAQKIPHNQSSLIAVGVFAFFIVVGESPGAIRSITTEKMPLSPQFEWLNDNEPENARVFIYGHMGFLGILYGDRLAERHDLQYFDWEKDEAPGLAEIQVLKGSAATGTPTYLAYCWPWDIPGPLKGWLEANADEAETWPGLDHQGILYRVRPEENSPVLAEDKPGGAIIDFRQGRRPEVVPGDDSDEPALRFSYTTSVTYAHDLVPGKRYVFEAVAKVEDERRPWFLTLSVPDGKISRIRFFSPPKSAGEELVFRVPFQVKQQARSFKLIFPADSPDYGVKEERGLLIERVRMRELEESEEIPEPQGLLALPPLTPLDKLQALGNWDSNPKGTFIPATSPQSEEARARYRFELVGERDGMLISPIIPAPEDVPVHVRVRMRPYQLYSMGGNAGLLFIDENGQPLGSAMMSTKSWRCEVNWDPIREAVADNAGEIVYSTIRPTPIGTKFIAVGFPIWKTSERFYPELAANELQILSLEFAYPGMPVK